ncbi:GAF domain-containing protein [Desulfobotulus alkaliphilus]|uniref:GAF domain-containing protein n=1 Tax=Desulfobotulus alkaliphilus TaxID=622671 RepID=A0A562RQU7_9BACT|nr:GAF domain-containing protein [Desulfobotulus alkaliphilus]TWI70736.1 GAF domain-containing protein [Desulfobotulus alkaliphilus]
MEQKPASRITLREFKAISHAISTYEDLTVLNHHLVEGICKAFNIKACSIFLYDDRENQLFRVVSHGLSETYLSKGPIIVDDNKNREALSGKVVFYQDIENDERVLYPKEAMAEGIMSMLSVPIKYHEHTLGLLKMYHSDPWILHEDDQDSFCVLAAHLGLRIEHTGLRNFFEMVKAAAGSLPLRMMQGLAL